MKFEGKEIEIRPLDSLETDKDTNNLEDLEFIGYYDLFKELYEKIDKSDNDEDRYESIERLQKIGQSTFGENKDFSTAIFDSISRNKDSREDLLRYLKDIDNKQLEVYLQAKEQVAGLRVEFKTDILRLFSDHDLICDQKKLNQLVDKIGIKFISGDIESPDDFTPAYYHSRHYIAFKLSPSLLEAQYFKKIFYHEFLHLLTSDYDSIISYKDKSNNEFNIGQQSTGFLFRGFGEENDSFAWLNEAMTEDLALRMIGIEGGNSYIQERELLNLLSKKKKDGTELDYDLLIKNYFRHLVTGEGSTVDRWRDFSKEVDNAFGPRFLVKLDLFIEKFGIEKAVEVVDSWTDGQPNIEDLKFDIREKK